MRKNHGFETRVSKECMHAESRTKKRGRVRKKGGTIFAPPTNTRLFFGFSTINEVSNGRKQRVAWTGLAWWTDELFAVFASERITLSKLKGIVYANLLPCPL